MAGRLVPLARATVLASIVGACGLASAANAQPSSTGFVPRAARVVVAGASGPARGGIHRARLDQELWLYAVVEGERQGRRVVVTAAPALILDGRRVPSRRIVPPGEVAGLELRWYKVEPTGDSYDNTRGGFHWDPISYREHPLGSWGAPWRRKADTRPEGYPDTHGGAGTMAYKVAARAGPVVAASPGKESIWRGGLSDAVPRVALRRDDTFVGRLTELFNTPYIWGSAGIPPAVHQAERLIGSDCADFVVYGARRMGKKLRYRATWHLGEVADTVARAEKVDEQGRFLRADGSTVAVGDGGVRVGDLLLFPRHVGALAQDRPPLGVLDTNDVMIHTYWAPPTEQPISRTAYADAPVQVLRWK